MTRLAAAPEPPRADQALTARFDVSGPPGALPLVLIHASGHTRQMWLPQARALASEFRIVALDLPGHGLYAGRRFRLEEALREVHAAVKVAGAPALVVGLSLGGYVALAFGAAWPEQTLGLALCGCSVSFEGRLGVLTRAVARSHQAFVRALPAPLVERVARRHAREQEAALRPLLPADDVAALARAGFAYRPWGEALLQVARHDVRALLRGYGCPVLIVNGERDRYNREQERAQLAAAHDGRLAVISGAGHICNLDAPDAFTRALVAFARELAAARPATRSA